MTEIPIDTKHWAVAQVINNKLTILGPLDSAGPAKSIVTAESLCTNGNELYVVEVNIIIIARSSE